MKKFIFPVLLILLIFSAKPAEAQGLSIAQIDSVAGSSLKLFPQAGIAVAVVKDGEVVCLKGYGSADVEKGMKVDPNTLFAIASNTKAFTATALAILVDEGKLTWNDRVVDHLPGFRMYEPYLTENFTITDLLTHRSGLGLGSGDLMIFPDGADFTIDELMASFRYMKPVSPFRTKYDYDNLLYIVAGEVIARVSGMPYTDFIRTRILDPLEMERTIFNAGSKDPVSNSARPHSTEEGEPRGISPYSAALTNAAGGLCSSVSDMSRWMLMQLNQGRYGKNGEKQLISAERQKEMWQPYTPITFSVRGSERYNSHFTAYGLGMQMSDYRGYVVLSHGGGLPGMLSRVTLVPELNLGICVLTNTAPGGLAYFTVTQTILDSYLGVEARDWNSVAMQALDSNKKEADSVTRAVWETVAEAEANSPDLESFAGRFKDNWFGEVEIIVNGGKLWFRSLRSPKLKGQMFFYRANTFAVKWDYTDMPCDAFAIFELDEEGKAVRLRMKGISPDIDFSFDFQDLELNRIE